MTKDLPPRKKFLLYHYDDRMDKTIASPRQNRRMIRKSEWSAKECRNREPVRNAADQSRLADHEQPIRPDRRRNVQMQIQGEQKKECGRYESHICLIPCSAHSPHTLSAHTTRSDNPMPTKAPTIAPFTRIVCKSVCTFPSTKEISSSSDF